MISWEDWQKPYQFGILVVWPPNELRELVSSQRERIDPVSASYCEAHITVTQPLSRHLKNKEWNELQVILSRFEPFELSYGPLKTFFPYPCIWYEIQPAEKILEIRDVLHQTDYFNLDLEYPENFIPHMTITEGLSGPEVDDKLYHRLQMESGTGLFQCMGLSYIVPNEDFKFEVKGFLPFSR